MMCPHYLVKLVMLIEHGATIQVLKKETPEFIPS